MANPRRAATVRPSAAAMAASRGPELEHYNWPLDLNVMFKWVVGSTATIDNTTVIGHQGGTPGRWLIVASNLAEAQHPALSQAAFYINSVTGSDLNDGAAVSTALATINEYLRRIGDGVVTIAGDGIQRVYLSGTFDEGEYRWLGRYSFGVEVYGERTVIGTGTISAVQEWAVATSDDGQITDSGLPTSWTASGFVGQMVVLTSGTNTGAVGWIGKDLGTKNARHSHFAQLFGGVEVHPSVSDTYEIVTLTKVTGEHIIDAAAGAWGFTFQDLHFEFDAASTVGIKFTGNAFMYMVACHLDGTLPAFGFMSAAGWIWDCFNCKVDMGVGRVDVSKASVFATVFCLVGARLVAEYGSHLEVSESLFQANLSTNASVSMHVNNNASFTVFSGALGLYDEDAVGLTAIEATRGGVVNFYTDAKIFGTGNACIGLQVDSGSSFFYPEGDALAVHVDITTTGTEVRYGTTDTTYAAVSTAGVVNAANHAMIVPTE